MSESMDPGTEVTGVILAGGQARRMGGRDKGLIEVGGRPMIEYALAALRPQVSAVIINANRNHAIYARYGCPLVADALQGYHGPLAGMASAMLAAQTACLATLPCDSPAVPADLVARLYRGLRGAGAEIVVAHDGERMQPVFSLLRCRLLDSLQAFLQEGERKIDRWYARHQTVCVDFSDCPEAFTNVNTPEDIEQLERVLGHA